METKMNLPNKEEWTLVGYFGVDSGLCWIGDPCYILHSDEKDDALGKDWEDFGDILYRDSPFGPVVSSDFDGLGICVSTGYGDGEYPVYALIINDGRSDRISAIFIDFLGMWDEDIQDEEEA
jgi:hypothetical protein